MTIEKNKDLNIIKKSKIIQKPAHNYAHKKLLYGDEKNKSDL